jgi:hypothetical protein
MSTDSPIERGPLARRGRDAESVSCEAEGREGRQLTFSAWNHELDNNENFSFDGRYVCYDTRETHGPGIEHSTTIEVLEVETGREIVVYEPGEIVFGSAPAPGVAAVSFNPVELEMAFIHGPLVSEVAQRGPYGWPNRTGARISLTGDVVEQEGRLRLLRDGCYALSWLDARDISARGATAAGAHRGGTHRHEFSGNGKRIGFTYDDSILPQYGRTVGYMERQVAAPHPASHYFAIVVPIVPRSRAQPGDIVKAYADSWVDPEGTMRAFIGVVCEADGCSFQESLFVADMPTAVDVTTAFSGDRERYPVPPRGITIRRLTHEWAGGIVRGSPDGCSVAYFGKDGRGTRQIFVISADGSDRHPDQSKRPIQVTFLPHGAEGGLRWFPDGGHILCVSNGGLVETCVREGDRFGRSTFLTAHGDGVERYAPAISPDGTRIAYNRLIRTDDGTGQSVSNYAGKDFSQIFLLHKNPVCGGFSNTES